LPPRAFATFADDRMSALRYAAAAAAAAAARQRRLAFSSFSCQPHNHPLLLLHHLYRVDILSQVDLM